MTESEYKTIAAVIASRRKEGDDYGTIRADLEATRATPFTPEEWAKLRLLAALDVAFSSVPKPTRTAPSSGSSGRSTAIHIHADTTGQYSVAVQKGTEP